MDVGGAVAAVVLGGAGTVSGFVSESSEAPAFAYLGVADGSLASVAIVRFAAETDVFLPRLGDSNPASPTAFSL